MQYFYYATLLISLVLMGCSGEQLPNGFYVSRADGLCYICSQSGTVVVDSNIIDYDIESSKVIGRLGTGLSFELDTESSTTTYSNGVAIKDGNNVVIDVLPNGYSLYSGGNHKHICTPRANFLIGHSRLRDVIADKEVVWAVNFDGQLMFLDTSSGECKIQIYGGKVSGTVWATSSVTNPIVERNVPPPPNAALWERAFSNGGTLKDKSPASD